MRASNGGVKVRPNTAAEDALARVSLVQDGRTLVSKTVSVTAYHRPPVFLRWPLEAGRYSVVTSLRAVLAPARTTTLTRPLLVN